MNMHPRNIAITIILTTLATASTACADEKDIVAKTVFDAQRAGFVRHDIKAYMSQWTDDAKLVGGRRDTPELYDFTMNRKQIESSRRMLFQGKPAITKVDFEVDDVKVEDDRATLRVRSTSHFDGGTVQVGEIYRLRKTGEGWKVFENRWWLIRRQIGDRTIVYDAEKLKRADAAVIREKRTGSSEALVSAMRDACRFKEAHRAAIAVTKDKGATAVDWLVRGTLAMQVGDANDAKVSFLKALSLDANVELPSYAARLKKEK